MDTIVFTLHQRPFYTRQVLEAWREVRGLEDWCVIFCIDPSFQTEAQVSVVEEFARDHPQTHYVVNKERLGVLKNPYRAMKIAFADPRTEYTVLAEEDVLPADDALEFFSFAKTLVSPLAACAWSDLDGDVRAVNERKWFNPWLWGTSKFMWDVHIRPTWDLDYSSADERGPGGWDCNLGLRVVHDRNLTVLFPEAARAQHIGKFLGVHQDPNNFGEVEQPLSFRPHRDPVDWVLTTVKPQT